MISMRRRTKQAWTVVASRWSAIVLTAAAALLSAVAPTRAAQVGLWHFEDNINDSSGNGNNGATVGGTTYSADTPPALGGGKSLDIDVFKYAQVPDSASLNITNALTIGAWVKIQNPVFFHWIAVKGPSPPSVAGFNPGNYEFRLFVNSPAPFDLSYNTNSVNGIAQGTSSANVTPNEWTHVAVTAIQGGANDTLKFYKNGVLTNTVVAGNSDLFIPNAQPMLIGSRQDGQVSDFLIDELVIYNEALSDSQVAQLARGPVIPEPATATLLMGAAIFVAYAARRRPLA